MRVTFSVSALVFAGVAAATTAFATPTGNLSIANIANGGVVVSATGIDFYPPSNAAANGVGDFSTGGFTNVSYGNGATLTAATNPYGQIKDIPTGFTGTITNFIQLYTGTTLPVTPGNGPVATAPVFDLVSLVPGGSAQGAAADCAGITSVGESCSPLVTIGTTAFVSPFVLTYRGTYTTVSLGVNLLARDGVGPAALWMGGFTAQVVNLTPSQIQTMFNSGLSIDNTISGTFSGSVLVREPGTLSLLGIGLATAGVLRRRFRS